MEGIYFFGEHVRWNLGWNNPNQAGAFIAMLIPWVWGLAAVVKTRSRTSIAISLLLLAAELLLWFLLCKTYSRGAMVAVGAAGFVVLASGLVFRLPGAFWASAAARVGAVVLLLVMTGFFARLDPGFVARDASAGNRLVLWQGGLQMIASSPWQGWGVGQSGSAFSHWFQPLDAGEKYAGMVNSYLHVGVERGLRVLIPVLTGALGFILMALLHAWKLRGEPIEPPNPAASQRRIKFKVLMVCLLIGAGGSWLVFLVANIFSTLWIFKNLWWIPAVDGIVLVGIACVVWKRNFLRSSALVWSLACAGAMATTIALLVAGNSLHDKSAIRIDFDPRQNRVLISPETGTGTILFYPEPSVLGDDWGKEIRRMAMTHDFSKMEIHVSLGDQPGLQGDAPDWIIACGNRHHHGFSAHGRFPQARLTLVHPVGKPATWPTAQHPDRVMLPMLDTRQSGRAWKIHCKRSNWILTITPGVGQDIRREWPAALMAD